MALLDIENIRRNFGGLVALDRVSFRVPRGQIKGLIGPNGAGKTTLFNIISGLLLADAGQVRFQERPITGMKPYQIARLGISRTFQNPSLFLRMTALENVMVGRHTRSRADFFQCSLRFPGQPREERRIQADARGHLEYLGLGALADTLAGALAFGQRRQVELARALAAEPELLLLDEPASGLNTREKADLGKVIRGIRDRGVTILLVEHDMAMVMDLADEIFVLHNGTPLAEGPPAAIQNDPNVIRVYLGGELRTPAGGELNVNWTRNP
jgi:branched-chain amino acid transport system ATP-binding protein